ncbi:hypothetical protein LINPERHAP2_LOCUS41793 [Linum perenne]
MTTAVAALPKYMVLRSKSVGKYVHYLWNEEEFGEYYSCLGCKKEMDPVNPYVKLEVVNATSDPPNFVHLRCSYNNKYLKLMAVNDGLLAVSATADEPDFENGSTLFLAVFPDDEDPNTVGFSHVVTEMVVTVNVDSSKPEADGVICMSNDGDVEHMHRFEFSTWVGEEVKCQK